MSVQTSAYTSDALPDVPGLAGHWERSVVHCPHCHGWAVALAASHINGVLAAADTDAALAASHSGAPAA